MTPLRLAVIGAGPMGRLHARAIGRRAARSGDCVLTSVVDRNLSRSAGVAAEFGGRAAQSLESCWDEIDAAVVAVPTRSHAAVTRRMLERGLDVLVEKPMFASVTEAEEMLGLARDRGCILGVGHVEWYNAALQDAVARAGKPIRIEAERFNSQSDRGLDIDVIQDFMLHDLDWITRIVGSEIIDIQASGRTVVNGLLDEAEADLEFASGCHARLRASRVHEKRMRRVRIEGVLSTVEIDLLEEAGSRQEVGTQLRSQPGLETLEPLDAEWADFLAACRSREAPENDAAVGLRAVEQVERVRQAILRSTGESDHENDPALGG